MPDLLRPHYILQVHAQACLTCGAIHTHNELYTCTTEKAVRRLRPATASTLLPSDDLIVTAMPGTTIALCHLCAPARPVFDHEAAKDWSQALRNSGVIQASPLHPEINKQKPQGVSDLF